jgi:TolB-like protein/DNA-binding winged helix-turn-helix (wHTH) protein/Tfp pilus assembly protein PilF
MVYEFGDFRLDCGRFELRRNGRSVRLERKPMELLILLAGRDGQLVTRIEIARHLWESEVFVDTEHGINTAIRKIRQVLADDPEQPRFVQTVTGMGYRFIAPLVRWEPEPEAVPGTAQGSEGEGGDSSVPVPTVAVVPIAARGRWVIWIGVGVVAALVILIVTVAVGHEARGNRLLHRGGAPVMNSLAVLPLDNLSGDAGQDYYADGMTDELTTMLVKDSTLRVTSRTSVMQFKGVHRPLREIAHELGVDGILEGSIARSGNHVHMTIQLIQAPTDTHVWAESYDRDVSDAVSLPREAAETIAKRVNRVAAQPAVLRNVSPAAHDAYLHGRYLWFAGNNEKAGEYFRKATELQPDYAQGWSGLSTYYGAGAIDGDLNPADSLAQQASTALKAVQLDGSLPEAHLAMCAAIFEGQWDWARADAECKRAIELDPEYAEAYHFRAKILAALNRHQEAIDVQKKATELDPFARTWALAYSYQLARQYDAALADARQHLESTPNDAGLHWILYETYRCKGMDKEASEELEAMLSLVGEKAAAESVLQAYRRGGYRAVVLEQIGELKGRAKDHYVSPVELAVLYAQLGRREEALSFLEEGYRQHSPLLLWVQDDPAFDFLHGEGRYRAVIKGVGLSVAY